MFVAQGHPNAPLAREAVKQRLGLETHQWATSDTAVVAIRTGAQLEALFRSLRAINQQHDPYFACVAFLAPYRQSTWWLSDAPENFPRLIEIIGRPPVNL